MIFRTFSLILDTILQKFIYEDEIEGDDHNSGFFFINDIIMLSFYFFELIPSFIIINVLMKSNSELKYKKILENHYTSLCTSSVEETLGEGHQGDSKDSRESNSLKKKSNTSANQ